jgi:tetratricopeptide (TPR) repeat protein
MNLRLPWFTVLLVVVFAGLVLPAPRAWAQEDEDEDKDEDGKDQDGDDKTDDKADDKAGDDKGAGDDEEDFGKTPDDRDDVDEWGGAIEKQDLNQVKQREEVKVDVADEPVRDGVSGNWYQVAVDCLYCDTILGQNLDVNDPDVMRQFFDHIQIYPDKKSGKMVFPSEGANRPLYVEHDGDRVVIFMYAIDNKGERTTALYCTVWDLRWLLRDQKLLYGRRYSIDAYQPFAFGDYKDGYKADETYLPREQLRTFLDLSVVQVLSETAKVFPIGEKAVLTYLGSDAFVRSDFEKEPYADAQARLFKDKVEREQRDKERTKSVEGGIAAWEDKEYDTAYELFQRADELDADDIDFHFYYGATLQGLKKYDDALTQYRIVLAKDPRDTTTRFNLAVILENQGRLKEALAEYRLILEYDPSDEEAKERAFNLMIQLQD